MKTNVRIPKFLDRYLTVFSFLTVLIGFIAIITINGLNNSDIFDTQAAPAITCCDNKCSSPGVRDICGCCKVTDNQCVYQKDAAGNCWGPTYTPGAEWFCGGKGFKGNPGSVEYGCAAGYYSDPFCTSTSGSSGCSEHVSCNLNESWCTDNTTQNTTNNTTQNTTTQEPTCPFDSTQARVREDASGEWVRELNLVEGESFQIGSFHNANFSSFASNTRISVTGPEDFEYVCRGDQDDCNGYEIIAAIAGTYTVAVTTRKPGGGVYTEAECRGNASVFADDANPNFTITKTVWDNDHTYDPGDAVFFDIVIRNTGNTTIDYLEFTDRYDPRYLDFVLIRHGNNHLTDEARIENVSNSVREIIIDDLTEHVGDIGVGESIRLTVRFTARSVTTTIHTINYAIVTDGDEEREDEDWIEILPPDVPPTDL